VDELLIGGERLELARLPGLTPRWARSVGRSPVSGVAALQDFLAYTVEGSLDVVIVPRPHLAP
jgi:hypothetical protein